MRKLPRRKSGPQYQFDDEIRLEYYRLQKISEGAISLRDGEASPLDGPSEVGSGLLRSENVPLSQLIDIVNERFGTDFNQADQLFFDQLVEVAIGDDNLRQAASVNPGEKFELLFKNVLERIFVERMDQNEEIFIRFMNDIPFQKVVTAWMASEAYRKLRKDIVDEKLSLPSLPHRLKIVEGVYEERHNTCIPLIPLKAAAGAFSDQQNVIAGDWQWVEPETKHTLREGMFIAQVVGKSMEPKIPDGSYCLFSSPVTGTRVGKIVLVQLRNSIDPETGERYTVKRYESKKIIENDTWHHTGIQLSPLNTEFEPIIINNAEEGQLTVIAELVEVF